MYCARHPSVETNLKCSRCDTPICPKCLVHAPVGVRCPDCAKLQKLPTFDVSYKDMARGLLGGLVVAVGLGYFLAFISPIIFRIPFLPWLVLIGVGYVVGEAVSLSTNKKRGKALMIIAAVCVLISFIIISMVGGVLRDVLTGLLALAASIYFAVTRVR